MRPSILGMKLLPAVAVVCEAVLSGQEQGESPYRLTAPWLTSYPQKTAPFSLQRSSNAGSTSFVARRSCSTAIWLSCMEFLQDASTSR